MQNFFLHGGKPKEPVTIRAKYFQFIFLVINTSEE